MFENDLRDAKALDQAKSRFLFLPPYSPDLDPIELGPVEIRILARVIPEIAQRLSGIFGSDLARGRPKIPDCWLF